MRFGLGLGLSVWNSNYLYPSMSLDFLSGSLDPKVTFNRASTATYFGSDGLLKVAAVGVPRFDYDPVTMQILGLLVEETRSNLILHSEEFNNVVWGKTNASVTSDALLTPIGLADNIIESAMNGTHGISQSITVVSGSTYTFSFYAKANGRSLVRAGFSNLNAYVVFDLAAGVVQLSDAGATGSIKSVGGGLYRCAVTQTATSTGSYNCIARMQSSTSEWPGSGTYTGDGVSGIYIIGAQIELGSYTTSYIPTTSSLVTRASESTLMTGVSFSDWFNQSHGTIVVEAVLSNLLSNRGMYGISDGTTQNEFFGYVSGSGNIFNEVRSGNVFQGDNLMSGVVSSGISFKTARAYAANDLMAATNGALSTADTTATMPVGVDRLTIGHRADTPNNGFKFNGHIRRLQYYNTRLTNSELQRLTS